MRLSLLFALLAMSASACGPSIPPYDYRTEPDPRTTEFTIGPLDQLSVGIWKNKELSAEVAVRPDGIITLPLIGDVQVASRTPSDVQKEIARRYSDFIRNEEIVVSVVVTAVNSYHFTVSGNVEHGGVFVSKSYVTAVEAIAMAGGPNRFAGSSMYIVRGTPVRRIPIDLTHTLAGERPEQNLYVMRGDVIVVP
jgi:polysaccharide export outer membrane protein